MQHLILASASPRRKELLQNLQLSFDIIPSTIEEIIDPQLNPDQMVISLAQQKASDVAKSYPQSYVIGADTIVFFQNQMLGKPKDEQDAFRMLKMLSGNIHVVLTGVVIVHREQQVQFVEKTKVTFWELSDDEIYAYIKSGEPMDKAGAYGIQQLGAILVKEINGDYYSVVGLPVARTIRALQKLGYYTEIQ